MQIRAIDSFAGQTLGKYHVERLLGRGRLSVVYLARDVTSQRIEALAFYFVPDHFPPEARNRFLARFLKEAAAVSLLRHPHILSISGYGESGGNPYLVTPYLTNGSLANVLRQRGRLPHPEVLAVLEQVAAALEYAHSKGLVHGALKPANIVLSSKHALLVSGFGLMRMLQMKGIVGSNQPEAHLLNVAGTPLAALEYVSPEMVQGLKVDSRADVYSLGAISFELLCGKPPFSGTDPLDVARQRLSRPVPSLRALYPDIPIALESVINQALERDPQRRFQHVSELVEAFRQVSQGASGAPGARERLNLGIYDGESPVHTDELPLSATFPGSASTRQLQDTPADGYPATNWQLVPPIVSGKLPAITPSQDEQRQPATTGEHTPGEENWQLIPPVITGGLPSVRVSIPSQSLAKKGAKPAAPPQPAQTPHSVRSKRSVPPAPQDMPPVQAQVPQARSVQEEDSPGSSSMQTVAQAVSEPTHKASGAGTMRPFDWWSMPGPTDASIYGRPAEAAPARTAQPADAS
ncbi:MAG: protein kinase, partial [Ktedonobacteraceae bacterium]|nr:protein kinase [Ktedonobacteraceae bacterium]